VQEDIWCRIEGRAGRITLQRPGVLNALTWEMCLEIEAALDRWAADGAVALVLIDAVGEKAFCAGGDIAEMYAAGRRGDFGYGQRFWADEYRLNAKIFHYAKPIVTFLQGFTMGGGVGVGCHGAHRIVSETSQIAMPECAIGLVPDVGGSLLLHLAPGRLGEYLGTTGARMDAGDAVYAGFADTFVPGAGWDALKATLVASGDVAAIAEAAQEAPDAGLATQQAEIDALFGGERLGDIARTLSHAEGPLAERARKALSRNAPLAMACAVEMQHRMRDTSTMADALGLEYRFTYRALEHSDFVEGIRAQIIDKDKTPVWRHAGPEAVPAADVARMLMPLGPNALKLEEK
jgi:enoyl-CoA hydratase